MTLTMNYVVPFAIVLLWTQQVDGTPVAQAVVLGWN